MEEINKPIPPIPQLVPPLKSTGAVPEGVDLKTLRFENAWMQWFATVRIKVNSINANVTGASKLTGTGIVFRDDIAWRTGSILGTTGRITVTNGDGDGGDPTINFDNAGVDARVTLGIDNHVLEADPHLQYALASESLRVVPVPSTATSTGSPGDVAYDASYFYVCHATNTWKRVAISTW